MHNLTGFTTKGFCCSLGQQSSEKMKQQLFAHLFAAVLKFAFLLRIFVNN